MGVIIKPLITEKATKESDLNRRYTFLVKPSVNKIQVKEAVKKQFGVDVLEVRTMVYSPKFKKKYTKKGMQLGKTNKLKKAIVELAEGQTLDLFANI